MAILNGNVWKFRLNLFFSNRKHFFLLTYLPLYIFVVINYGSKPAPKVQITIT